MVIFSEDGCLTLEAIIMVLLESYTGVEKQKLRLKVIGHQPTCAKCNGLIKQVSEILDGLIGKTPADLVQIVQKELEKK